MRRVLCGLTFDLSGPRRLAKPAGEGPLEGGVRRYGRYAPCGLALAGLAQRMPTTIDEEPRRG